VNKSSLSGGPRKRKISQAVLAAKLTQMRLSCQSSGRRRRRPRSHGLTCCYHYQRHHRSRRPVPTTKKK
jgi:hypothetical protein